MAKGCIGSILLMLGVFAMFSIAYTLGFTPLAIILGLIAGIGICFLDWWIVIGYKTYAKKKISYKSIYSNFHSFSKDEGNISK